MPAVVRALSWGLRKTMRIGGAEGLSNAVNVFVGMVEAPLFIRPYIGRMTRSELFSVMTYALCGFANPGSLGIMIGGMSTMAPDRRNEIVELGLRSIVSGTLTSCIIGSMIGVIGA